jgi:lambda family phage portal protein
MKISGWDRFWLSVAPGYGERRITARARVDHLTRHYDAASPGRRTENWRRDGRDADLTLLGASKLLREHARDLLRNNGYAIRAQAVLAGKIIGTGILPKAEGPGADVAADIWKRWALTTECESDNRASFNGIQAQIVNALVADGEVFLRRRWRRVSDGLTIPLQVQVLEADYLNTGWNNITSDSGGPIIQGIEFDGRGRRTGYYMWPKHPGSGRNSENAKFVPASEIVHVYDPTRPGMNRGVSWLGAAILAIKDFDEFEDAELMKAKIAACFAAFVTDVNGGANGLGDPQEGEDDSVEHIEPGLVSYLEPGRDVKTVSPPAVTDSGLAVRTLRKVAASLKGITYEELTGDFSNVNFSSARMGALATRPTIERWQYEMIVPLACQGVWDWAMEAAQYAGLLPDGPLPSAEWTCPPMPMVEPEKEIMATVREVRAGLKPWSVGVAEQGRDPVKVLAQLIADKKAFDAAGLVLDVDPSKTTQSGQEQPSVTAENAPPEPAPPSGD